MGRSVSSSSSSSSDSDSDRERRRRHRDNKRKKKHSSSSHSRRRHRRDESDSRRRRRRSTSRRHRHRSSGSDADEPERRKRPSESPAPVVPPPAAPVVTLSAEQSVARVGAISRIEQDGFTPSAFVSGAKKKGAAPGMSTDDQQKLASMASTAGQQDDWADVSLCHPKLSENALQKEEQWIKKLFALRQKLLGTSSVR